MPTKSPLTGRPGLTKSPAKRVPLKTFSGRSLSVPTNGAGRPRVPRKFIPKKTNFVKRPPPLRTKPFVPAGKRAATKAVPKIAQTAAKRGGLALAGKFATRALSAYGFVSLVADLFELANPFVQDWLAGGWRGAEGVAYPESPSDEVLIEGGQCKVNYKVEGRFGIGRPQDPSPFTHPQILGSVGPIEYRPHPTIDNFTQVGYYYDSGKQFRPGPATSNTTPPPFYEITKVTRLDGFADNCGNLTGEPTQNPAYDNPVLKSPPEFTNPSPVRNNPLPFSPSTPVQPSSPSYLPPPRSPVANPKNAPKTPNITNPGYSEETGTVPSTGTASTPQTTTNPDYSSPNPRPTKPSSGSCQSSSDSPCQSDTFEMLEYVSDQIDRLEPAEKECPESSPLARVNFSWVTCEQGEPTIQSGSFLYDPLSFLGLETLLQQQVNLANQGCRNDDGVLAVPDTWVGKSPKVVPTLVLVFRSANSRNYHSYSVPHPASTEPYNEPPVGPFTKGNFMVTAVLDDNSKCQINCDSASEAQRVVNQFVGLVDEAYKTEGPPIRISERFGTQVARSVMNPTSAMFYADGNRTLRPVWRRSYVND